MCIYVYIYNICVYVWNSLPQHLRDPLLSPNAFKCRLKTHLFHVAFN